MITEYSDYFKEFAGNHPILNEQGTEGERAFFSLDFTELLGNFRNGIREKGMALYLLNYQSRFEGLDLEQCEGGFVVMQWFDNDKQGAQIEALAATEAVVMSLIAQMQKDSNSVPSLFLDSFQNLDSFEKVVYQYQANNNYIGWLVTFNWYHQHNMSNFLID